MSQVSIDVIIHAGDKEVGRMDGNGSEGAGGVNDWERWPLALHSHFDMCILCPTPLHHYKNEQ